MNKLSGHYQNKAKHVAIVIFIIVMGLGSNANAMFQPKHNSSILNDSLLIDKDGNKYKIKKFNDNNLWMTDNLKLNTAGSYCYGNLQSNCEQYGRLYTWESAKKGCALLGEGWRLPTNDEWKQLAAYVSGFPKDSLETRKKAYSALLTGGNSGFDAVLGGGRENNGEFRRLDAHGFYWTATESHTNTAWFSNFGKGSQSLYYQIAGEKPEAFAVRCVKKQ